MLNPADAKSRFATMMQFAPPTREPSFSLTQVLVGFGLIVAGIGIGTQLAPVIQNWNRQRGLRPRTSAPMREIDRWANEGGAVAPPSFPKGP